MFIHSYSAKGLRPTNEDFIVIDINNNNSIFKKYHILAIFDGHGGNNVSKLLSATLINFFHNKNPLKNSFIQYVQNLFACFQQKILAKSNTNENGTNNYEN